MKALRNLKIIVAALAVLVAAGTAGFHFIEGWPWFDGFYMVVTTFSTIGYQEVHPLSHAGRIFNVTLIILGVGMLFLAIGTATQALLEFELGQFVGRRRMEREIERLSGHYILCGAGRVGRSAARELARERVPFVVVENDREKLTKYSDAGWLTLVGDATQEKILRDAHIERARGLVAATTTDATNMYIVLTARSLNPKLRIIARASEEEAEKHLTSAGADSVISPYTFAGRLVAQSFLRPHVLNFLNIAVSREGKLDLEIEEIHVENGSSFAGKTIEGSRIRQELGVIVLAIKREAAGMSFNPAPEDRIEAGDYLIAMGEPASLRRLEETATARAR
ncbi:MAG TPA: potassium channel protein [Terriglobales bacterium]|nr:potassium channel protein [Terriglobales bacterium]